MDIHIRIFYIYIYISMFAYLYVYLSRERLERLGLGLGIVRMRRNRMWHDSIAAKRPPYAAEQYPAKHGKRQAQAYHERKAMLGHPEPYGILP